ncbi:hypothetical protein BU17DRAFT_93503 [Hysterangium stoloniferum]|nr:hypothetical protein BU17DRAFT_93503 [Hysterangium stoloniferum]
MKLQPPNEGKSRSGVTDGLYLNLLETWRVKRISLGVAAFPLPITTTVSFFTPQWFTAAVMKPQIVAKWLEDNADPPPPPSTPAGLPDDSVSTVYPESSVSNPYASRYTGMRNRPPIPISRASHPPSAYLDRRPTSAQAHYRERESHPPVTSTSPSRNRHNSFSPEPRYMPPPVQPLLYSYAQPKSNQVYHAPSSAHHVKNSVQSRGGNYNTSTPQYRVVSPSPHRVESPRSNDTRQYTAYAQAYHSTPTITLQTRTVPKKAPLLRRIFGGIGGLEWGSAPAKTYSQPRDTSRSSSKSKSNSHSRSSDRESSYRPSRPRTHSDNVVYVRY